VLLHSNSVVSAGTRSLVFIAQSPLLGYGQRVAG
jgi:hypothetical protein